MKNRILSLLLSAVMLLAPCASLAEEAAMPSYYAGELTKTVISDSYIAGEQMNLTVNFGVDAAVPFEEGKLKAALDLLKNATLQMSFYDDFGTARIHADLLVSGAELFSGDMLIYEDGSVQAMSSLTGQYVLALPAGTFADGHLDLSVFEKEYQYDFETEEGIAAFKALPAMTRLRITSADVFSMLIGHLLGWVSYAQMDTDGQLYVFDDTYLDATETRDPVAQRMIGTIEAHRFNTLPRDIAMTLCDNHGEFQQAVADVLAEHGVTRYQVRQFVDALMTEETIDPAVDWVQPSVSVADDGALCRYDDISYFFKKLMKCARNMWEESTENVLGMVVSYDDFGGMVGFDADLKKFTEDLPYEGTFNYSIKTDDNWQRLHAVNGELEIYNDNRVIGDLRMQFGQDVGGLNETYIIGQADVVNRKDNTSFGIGLDTNLDFSVAVDESGLENEMFEGSLIASWRENGAGNPVLAATMSGMTTTDGQSFGLSGTAAVEVADRVTLIADATFETAPYEEIPFAGGQAIDMTDLDEEKLEKIKTTVKAEAAKLGVSLVLKPDVVKNVLTLIGD
ncbi:MAG: hypothetical protein IJE71_05380 [Clostridia bacterium]|nr:hypothetical protein [Clostridia bacterium]